MIYVTENGVSEKMMCTELCDDWRIQYFKDYINEMLKGQPPHSQDCAELPNAAMDEQCCICVLNFMPACALNYLHDVMCQLITDSSRLFLCLCVKCLRMSNLPVCRPQCK